MFREYEIKTGMEYLIHIQIYSIHINIFKFQLKLKILIFFGPILPENSISGLKQKIGYKYLEWACSNVATIPDKIFGTKWSNPVKLD